MTPLQSRKQLLVTEATLQRELLRADIGRLTGHVGGIKRELLSVSTMVRSGLSLGRMVGLFRKSSGTSSKLGRLLGLVQTGWSLWTAWNTAAAAKRTKPSAATEADQDLAAAVDALRRASKATS